MKRLSALFLALIATTALAAPPYDVTVSFDPPTTGGPADGFNFYVDDCAATGATGAPVGSVSTGQTFVGLITADGTYDMCVRSFNASGENPDPGPVATVNVSQTPLPGVIENFDIVITCRDGGGTVIDCTDGGVNVTVTIN